MSIELGVGFEVLSRDFKGVDDVSVLTTVESSAVFSLGSLKSVSYKSTKKEGLREFRNRSEGSGSAHGNCGVRGESQCP